MAVIECETICFLFGNFFFLKILLKLVPAHTTPIINRGLFLACPGGI